MGKVHFGLQCGAINTVCFSGGLIGQDSPTTCCVLLKNPSCHVSNDRVLSLKVAIIDVMLDYDQVSLFCLIYPDASLEVLVS